MESKCFMWAVMYQPSKRATPRISCIYPTYKKAKDYTFRVNQSWKKQNLGDSKFTVKRYYCYFKGEMIDFYSHNYQKIDYKHDKTNN